MFIFSREETAEQFNMWHRNTYWCQWFVYPAGMKITWSLLNMISHWSAHCDWLLVSNLSLYQSGCGSMYFQPSSNELLFFSFPFPLLSFFVNIVDFAQVQRLCHLNFRPFFSGIVTRQEWACSRSLPECPLSSLSSSIFSSAYFSLLYLLCMLLFCMSAFINIQN